MKKRLKGLLALSMVVVMALAMTTGVASAVDPNYYYNGGTDPSIYNLVDGSTVVFPQQYIGATGSGNSFVITDVKNGTTIVGPTATTPDAYGKITDTGVSPSQVVPDKYCVYHNTGQVYSVPDNAIGYYGYITYLGSLPDRYKDDSNSEIGTLYLKPRLTKYTIKYDANSGTGTIADEDFTVEQPYTVNDGSALKRDGYRFAGWNLERDGSGVAIPAGSNPYQIIELLNKAGRGTVPGNTNHLISVLYAQWTPSSAGGDGAPPTTQPPLDKSPAAGDTFPTAPLIMLMLLSAGAAVAVKRRKA